ncbi:MAG TPA: glycosyl hydrolase family 18 protein [Trueperaceae bacterium]
MALIGAAAAQGSWCVAVWYPSSEHPGGADSITKNLDVIDVVHPFWFTPNAEGGLLDQSGVNAEEQVRAWQEAGLLVLPSVFSGHAGFLSEDLRPAHVRGIVDLVLERGFDGIDVDYEGFPLATRGPFSEFVAELAEALHASGKLLAVTVHAKTEDAPPFEGAAAQDWSRLAAAADIFNLMTYDFTNRNEPPGPVADIGWVGDVVGYASTVTDLANVRVGVPFYGYSWTRARPPARATTWEASDRLVRQFDLAPERDPASGELRIDLDVRGLPRQVIYVNDGRTLSTRLQALEGRAVGGLAIWGLGGEDPAVWDVLREARPAQCAVSR